MAEPTAEQILWEINQSLKELHRVMQLSAHEQTKQTQILEDLLASMRLSISRRR